MQAFLKAAVDRKTASSSLGRGRGTGSVLLSVGLLNLAVLLNGCQNTPPPSEGCVLDKVTGLCLDEGSTGSPLCRTNSDCADGQSCDTAQRECIPKIITGFLGNIEVDHYSSGSGSNRQIHAKNMVTGESFTLLGDPNRPPTDLIFRSGNEAMHIVLDSNGSATAARIGDLMLEFEYRNDSVVAIMQNPDDQSSERFEFTTGEISNILDSLTVNARRREGPASKGVLTLQAQGSNCDFITPISLPFPTGLPSGQFVPDVISGLREGGGVMTVTDSWSPCGVVSTTAGVVAAAGVAVGSSGFGLVVAALVGSATDIFVGEMCEAVRVAINGGTDYELCRAAERTQSQIDSENRGDTGLRDRTEEILEGIAERAENACGFSDDDCSAGKRCINGQCVETDCPASFEPDGQGGCECPIGFVVVQGTCCPQIDCGANASRGSNCLCQCNSGFVPAPDGVSCMTECTDGRIPVGLECVCPANMNWNGSSCVCTANSAWDGSNCVCNFGFTVSGSECVELECPANSIVNGNECVCPSNMVWNGTECVCPTNSSWNGSQCVCTANSSWDGEFCVCDAGFVVSGFECVRDCPANSTPNAQGGCTCDSGFSPCATACVASRNCPDNSSASCDGDGCVCNDGYVSDGTQCWAEVNCGSGALPTGPNECTCGSGFTPSGTTCVVSNRSCSGCGAGFCQPLNAPAESGCCSLEFPYLWGDDRCHTEPPSTSCSDPAGVRCTCPDTHFCIGNWCNGVLWHSSGIFCGAFDCNN